MKIIKFERKGCVPCVAVTNFLGDLKVKYETVDVEENTDKAIKFGVMTTPMTFLVDEEDNILAKSIGYKPAQLEEMISKL